MLLRLGAEDASVLLRRRRWRSEDARKVRHAGPSASLPALVLWSSVELRSTHGVSGRVERLARAMFGPDRLHGDAR